MAGNITVLPSRKTGFGEFTDAFTPYLQQAMQMYLQSKMQDIQQQKMMETLAPTGYTEKIPSSYKDYVKSAQKQGAKLDIVGTPEEQTQAAQQLFEARGFKPPEIPERWRLKPDKLVGMQPTIDVMGGGLQFKEKDYVSQLLERGINPFTGMPFKRTTPTPSPTQERIPTPKPAV